MKYYLMCDNGIVGHIHEGGKGTIASAYALINSEGKLLAEDCQIEKEVTNNYGELKAIREGIIFCLKNNYKDLIILSDSQLAVNFVKDIYSASSDNLRGTIQEVKELLKLLTSYEIKWIPREYNLYADTLTCEGLKEFRKTPKKYLPKELSLQQQIKFILEAQ